MDAFAPTHLEVIDESHQHNVPDGAQSHFKAVVVSDNFAGKSRIERHKQVYRVLCEELDGLIKAFSVMAYDPTQWEHRQGNVPASPPCMGGREPI